MISGVLIRGVVIIILGIILELLTSVGTDRYTLMEHSVNHANWQVALSSLLSIALKCNVYT